MAKSRRTISRDSVFRSGGRQDEALQQGLNPDEQPSRQTAVWLTDAEVVWLDDQCQAIKRAGWRSVTRSALIRSLIRAAMEDSVELGGVTGERELAERLASGD